MIDTPKKCPTCGSTKVVQYPIDVRHFGCQSCGRKWFVTLARKGKVQP